MKKIKLVLNIQQILNYSEQKKNILKFNLFIWNIEKVLNKIRQSVEYSWEVKKLSQFDFVKYTYLN